MKKLKSMLCVVLLSAFLVGNVFAGNTTGGGFFGFFDNMVNAVVMMLNGGGGNCKPRQCTNCKVEDLDENGNCRPK